MDNSRNIIIPQKRFTRNLLSDNFLILVPGLRNQNIRIEEIIDNPDKIAKSQALKRIHLDRNINISSKRYKKE